MKRALFAIVLLACVQAREFPRPTASPELRVDGEKLRFDGKEISLAGVNLSGSEFQCIKGDGIFDGPDVETLIKGLASWNINAVRIPLNESCWLGDSRLSSKSSGPAYRDAIIKRIQRFRALGWFVIVDLHWSSTGTDLATGIAPMPHAKRAPEFWTSVAGTFKSDLGVLFDLYNEPHIANLSPEAAWQCWRDGCTLDKNPVAGMQALADAVRHENARNLILISGLNWANDVSQWMTHQVKTDLLAISFHAYNFNRCNTPACFHQVPRGVPLVVTEFGENDCASAFSAEVIGWARSRGASFLAWTWNLWDCKKGPALIERWDGTPTPYGSGVRALLRQ